jgi:hypothetical protein
MDNLALRHPRKLLRFRRRIVRVPAAASIAKHSFPLVWNPAFFRILYAKPAAIKWLRKVKP